MSGKCRSETVNKEAEQFHGNTMTLRTHPSKVVFHMLEFRGGGSKLAFMDSDLCLVYFDPDSDIKLCKRQYMFPPPTPTRNAQRFAATDDPDSDLIASVCMNLVPA